MERIRVMVFRREGVEPAPVEGVAGCFRRKSVRISAPLGCGSEMFPNEDPLFRREDLWRCAAKRHIDRTARSAPAMRPGKNPTRSAVTGNWLQGLAVAAFGQFEVTGTGIALADCVLVEDAVEEGAEEDAGLRF